jgi:hypothetical protein
VIRPRARWSLAAAAVGGFAVATAVRAQTPRLLEPDPGARLEAGATVSVSWTAGLAARTDVEEMELVLSLDGGRSFPLRVTRTLSPEARSFSWRVPSLPTAHARLALRSGREGEEDSETIRMTSGEFAIDAALDAPLEETFRIRGEWRTREALESSADSPDPGAFRQPEERIRTRFGPDRPAEPPTSISPAPGRGGQHTRVSLASCAGEPGPSPPDSRPTSIPLRQ